MVGVPEGMGQVVFIGEMNKIKGKERTYRFQSLFTMKVGPSKIHVRSDGMEAGALRRGVRLSGMMARL